MAKNRYVCSVDIGGTKIACAIMEYPASGECPHAIYRAEVPTDAQEGGEAVYRRIEDAIRTALADDPAREVLGVGIGAAGVIDPKTGAVAYANEIMPGWSGIELGPRLREALSMPVAVVGDVQAHALGEAHWGVGRGRFSVLCLGIGTGIGGAYVEDGRVMRGFHGAAGHMGHVESISAADIPCACGRSGHIESVASGTSIGRMFDERYGRVDESRPSVGRDVNDLCIAGDERAISVIHDAGFALGATLGSLANILDPEVIVLSGGVIHQGPDWRSETWKTSVAEGYASQALDPLLGTPILIGELEGEAPLIGAAEHLLNSL
ncbi:MAG: ROK family protein [Collinsella sp.]|nr:ROK family protein [Collinsella sp.]